MEGARCHHDVVRLEPVVAGGYDVPVAVRGESVHPDAGSDWQTESPRVALDEVGDLVLAGNDQAGPG